MHGEEEEREKKSPVTRVVPGGRDQTTAVKHRKKSENLNLKKLWLWQNISGHILSASWVSPKWVKSNARRRKKERKRKKVTVKNDQVNAWTNEYTDKMGLSGAKLGVQC